MIGHKRVVQPQTPRRIQTSVFRVHIHCDGCKKKVKKLVQKIKGVESIAIDAELGKLTVVGYVSPGMVIKKLEKSGKHAEMWGAYKSSYNLNRMNNQFKNMQIDFYDSGTEKPQHGKSRGHKQVQLATKDPKPVKFECTDEDEFYKREGRDSLDDSDDGFELDFGRDSRKKPGKGSKETKATKGKMKKEKKKKKGGFFGIFRLGKKDKNKGNGGKKGSGGGARKSYSREEIYRGKAVGKSFGHVKDGSTGKDCVMNGKNPPRQGGPTHQGMKSEPSFEIDLFDRGKGGGGPGRGGGGGGATGGRLAVQPGHPGGYPSGPAQYEAQGSKIPPMHQAQMGNIRSIAPVHQYQDHANEPSMNQARMNFPMNQAGTNFPMNQAGTNFPMNQAGTNFLMNQAGTNFPMNQAGTNFPMNQVPGVPAMTASNGSGHYPPMGQDGMCNPQYMAMMGQQQAQWNGMAQPMMYGGPNPRPSFSYVLPMAMPARYTDRYTLMFNDENTESCSIM